MHEEGEKKITRTVGRRDVLRARGKDGEKGLHRYARERKRR